MDITVIGCGWLGLRVAQLGIERGATVFGVRRNPVQSGGGIRWVAADVTDAESLRNLPVSDAIVYAVAAAKHDSATYEAAYVKGLENVMAHLRRTNQSPRLVFVSSTGVFGQDDGAIVDESSETSPTSFSGKAMLAAEAVATNASSKSIILRLSGLYGPGRDRLLRQVRDNQIIWDAPGDEYMNRIYRDDAAEAVLFLLSSPDRSGVYVGSDPNPVLRSQVLNYLGERLGRSVPPPLAGSVRNKRCMPTRLLNEKFRFQYPSFAEGFNALIDANIHC